MAVRWKTLLAVGLVSGSAWAGEATTWKDSDFALYPQYCRARLDNKSKLMIPVWEKKIGAASFLHVHHYCFGMKAVALAYANYTDKNRRRFFANATVSETAYFLEHAPEESPLRAEALITQGRGFMLADQPDDARERFEAALEIDPNMVDAWAFLSDVHVAQGRKQDAIKVLQDAREKLGDQKKILLRLKELGVSTG